MLLNMRNGVFLLLTICCLFFQLVICKGRKKSEKSTRKIQFNPDETLLNEIHEYLRLEGYTKDDVITKTDFHKLLIRIFEEQFENKERHIFFLLADKLMDDLPENIVIKSLDRYLQEDKIFTHLEEITHEQVKLNNYTKDDL